MNRIRVLTIREIAQEFSKTPAQVRRAIRRSGQEPATTIGNVKLFDEVTAEQIGLALSRQEQR